MPCSNAAKTRYPLKYDGVPQTRQSISAVSGPKFPILRGHVEDILLLNKFFFRLSIHALVAKIWPDKVVRWCRDGDFLRPVFPASRMQRISDLHSKFALRPHHVPQSMVNIQSPTAEIRRGKEEEEEEERNKMKLECGPMPNVMVALRRKVWLTPTTRCRAVTLPRRETR